MQHAVEHGEVCQPDWMTLVSLTGSLTSLSRLPAQFLPVPAAPPPGASAASGEAPNLIVHIPRPMHAGQACPRLRISVLAWRLWFGLAMDVGLPRAVRCDDATYEQQSAQRDVPRQSRPGHDLRSRGERMTSTSRFAACSQLVILFMTRWETRLFPRAGRGEQAASVWATVSWRGRLRQACWAVVLVALALAGLSLPAQAQLLRPFTVQFTDNKPGDIYIIGNTLFSCDPRLKPAGLESCVDFPSVYPRGCDFGSSKRIRHVIPTLPRRARDSSRRVIRFVAGRRHLSERPGVQHGPH